MALTLGDNFSYQGAKPLDARLKYATLAEMSAVADATMYDGCLAYCVATDKTYQWKSTNEVDADTGKWREFSSGSAGTTDYTDLTNKPQIEGVTLSGNKTASDLGLAKSSDIPTELADLTDDSTHRLVTDTEKSTWNGKQNELTAGDGIDITNDEISVDEMPSSDMSEILTPLPSTQKGYHKYSTEEQVVGKWIDGSTLYQKTIAHDGAFPTNANISIDISALNIDKCIDIRGFSINTNGACIPINFTNTSLSNEEITLVYIVQAWIGSNGTTLLLRGTKVANTYDKQYVTIQYTKTTS